MTSLVRRNDRVLEHSNVDYATGGLGRWLALNRPHRSHHVAAIREGDVNAGLFTAIWDGSSSAPTDSNQRGV